MNLTDILARCVPDGDCLIWTGAKSREGYGRVRHDRKVQPTHRAVYELMVGPIPDGLTIDHVAARGCHSRLCMNVDHMEPVTLEINSQRGSAMRAIVLSPTCPHGHERTDVNTGHRRDGRSYCLPCNRERQRTAA